MSFPKIIFLGAISLFVVIGVTAVVKKSSSKSTVAVAKPRLQSPQAQVARTPVAAPQPLATVEQAPVAPVKLDTAAKDDFPVADRIQQLFTTGPAKLPIVETVTYSSKVSWLVGRPAWISDYSTYYATSRHFIARGLNGKADYFTQTVSSGKKFNVFRKDKRINFYLLIDLSRCKMGFYYVDLDTHERVLLKTYAIGVGRLDSKKASGSLTPLGKYSLGSKIAIYKPGTTGLYQDQKVDMISVFGTRWIPFDLELEGCTAPSKGYGLHGLPWRQDPATGRYVECRDLLGLHDSDGCIRLAHEDIEELFAIVVTKPTYVEIVKDYTQAKLPGVEVR